MQTSLQATHTRPLTLLAIVLPLILLATSLLPPSVEGTPPLSEQAPTSGEGGQYQQVRSGDGATPQAPQGDTVQVEILPQDPDVVSGVALGLSVVVTPPSQYGRDQVVSYSWSLSNSTVGALAPTDQATTTFYAGSVLSPTPVSISVTVVGWVPLVGFGWPFSVQAATSITVVPPLSATDLRAAPDPCTPGEEVALSWEVVGGVPPYESLVQFGDGSTAEVSSTAPGLVDVEHVFDAGSFQPAVTVSSSDGESSTTSSENSVVVTARLGVSLVLPPGADDGALVTLSSSVGGGTPPYSYHWSNSWGDVSYSSSTWGWLPSRSGGVTFSLTVTDSAGQSATAPGETLEVAPTPTLSLSSLLPEVDVGTAFPLELTVRGGTGPFSASWTPGARAPTLSTQLPGDGTFAEPYAFNVAGSIWSSGIITDSVGDTDSVGATTGSVVPLPTLSLTATPPVATVGAPEVLTASVSGGIPPYSWGWSFNGPASSSSPSEGTLSGSGSVTWNGSMPSPENLVATFDVVDSSGGSVSSSLPLTVEAALVSTLTAPAGRGEVGVPSELLATVAGGQGPYLLTWSASDGETGQGQLAQQGTWQLPLIPRVPGNLSVVLDVQDQLGRTSQSTDLIPVAGAFDPILGLTKDPIDTGGATTAVLTFVGGWAPFSGTLSDSDGQSYAFQSGGPTVSTVLGSLPPGTVDVKASVTDAIGESALVDQVLTVDPAPSVKIMAGMPQTDVGVPVPFAVVPAGGTGSYPQVEAYFGDGNASATWDPEHAYARPGTYLVNASVVDSSGTLASSPILRLVVVAAPAAIASLSTVGADAGLGASFSSEVVAGTPPFTYLWDFGDGTQSEEADPTHTFASPGAYHVELTVHDSQGVESVAPPLNVTVSAPAALSASANRSVLEVGVAATFGAQQLGGAPPGTVLWSFGDGSSQMGWTVNHTFESPGTFQVLAEFHDGAGGSASQTVLVSVAPPLQAGPVELPVGGAEVGVPLTVQDFATGGLGPYQFTWQMGTSQASAPGLTSWTIVPTTPGLQSGQVQVVDGTGARWTQGFQIMVEPPLTLNVTSGPSTPEAGWPFRLAAGASGGVGPLTFDWSLPSGISDPGNRSAFVTLLGSPGSYPVSVQATDALGRVVTSTLVLSVAPALSMATIPTAWWADAGMPIQLHVAVTGGVGAVTTLASTPFGTFDLGAGPVVFPTAGTFLIQFTAQDADGAMAFAEGNLTVAPPPALVLTDVHSQVAVGAPVRWAAYLVGGAGASQLTWTVPGVGSWTGDQVNITFSSTGSYAVLLSARDGAGGGASFSLNTTAVADPLSLSVNATETVGVAPFEPLMVMSVVGGTGPVELSVLVDGIPTGPSLTSEPGVPSELPVSLSAGNHVVSVEAVDALGEQRETSLELIALPPAPVPLVSPAFPTATAGALLSLSATLPGTNGSTLAGAFLGLRWWGPGVHATGPGIATFLSDRVGTGSAMVSVTVGAPGSNPLENTTLQVPIRVVAGPAEGISASASASALLAGENASVFVTAVDAFGNTNDSFDGPLSLVELYGPRSTETNSTLFLQDGQCLLQLSGTKAGSSAYRASAAGLGAIPFTLNWSANPYRASLHLLSWYRAGTSLVVNISAWDAYGNPLNNVTIEVEVPGGPTETGTVFGGNATVVLPGAADATSLVLLGPDGAQTTVALPDPSDPSGWGWGLLLAAAATGALLASGVLLGQRRRRRTHPGKDTSELAATLPPSLLEAKGTLEDIIDRSPGEDRTSLLVIAEDHGITRQEAEEALVLLEQDGRVERKSGSDGVERYDPRDPPAVPSEATKSSGPRTTTDPVLKEEVRP